MKKPRLLVIFLIISFFNIGAVMPQNIIAAMVAVLEEVVEAAQVLVVNPT